MTSCFMTISSRYYAPVVQAEQAGENMAIGVWRQAGGATGPLLYGIRQQPRLARVGIGGAAHYPTHRHANCASHCASAGFARKSASASAIEPNSGR